MVTKAVISILTLISLTLALPAGAKQVSPVELKSDSLHYLQGLRSSNIKRLQEIDQTLEKRVEETPDTSLEREVSVLKADKREHMLRQEFLDRLIFQIDTKFSGGDLRAFLERALVDMAKVDAVSSQADTGLWKFLKYASDAIHRLPEQEQNTLPFIEGYMNRSVSNPIRPEDYLATRNYTNGVTSESGSPLERDEVGAYADRRLHELNQPSNNVKVRKN